MSIQVLNYRAADAGIVKAFIDIYIPKSKLTIRNIRYLEKGTSHWYQMPQYKQDEQFVSTAEFDSDVQKIFLEVLAKTVKEYLANRVPETIQEDIPF